MSSAVFQSCVAELGEDVADRDLLSCVADGFSHQSSRQYARSILLVLAAALVFFMQAGFAM